MRFSSMGTRARLTVMAPQAIVAETRTLLAQARPEGVPLVSLLGPTAARRRSIVRRSLGQCWTRCSLLDPELMIGPPFSTGWGGIGRTQTPSASVAASDRAALIYAGRAGVVVRSRKTGPAKPPPPSRSGNAHATGDLAVAFPVRLLVG